MVDKKRIVETLISLVKIDSPSENEDAIAQELTKRFETLGGDVHSDKPGNVIARFEGQGEPIILSAHMDTVEPGRNIEPVIDGDIVTSRGETVLGADPKAGLAAIIEALTSLKEDGKKHLPIEVVVTREEETGSKGAKELSYSDLKSTKAVVFDGDEQVFRVNTAAPGYYKFDATIIGRAAHAGVEPERGISAILIAAELIVKLPAGRIDEETTANIGVINGGTARNAVPEKVELKGETRSRNAQKLEEQAQIFRDSIRRILEKYPEAKIEYELVKQFDSFAIPSDDPFVREIDKALSALNLKGSYEPTGGGSDANFFNAKGIKAVVVGTGVRDMHTTKESLNIPEMVEASLFCEKLLEV